MESEYQRGIALISVLWITTLLAAIAASFASSARTEARLARNMLENAKAEALADGAVYGAVLGLLDADPERAWRPDGTAYRLDYGDGAVSVRIFDEDAKVDLNTAPPELLEGLLRLVGVEPEEAGTLAARIVDFRDGDHVPQPNGAEDPDYEAAGRPAGAIDRNLASESELLGVLGISEALYRRLRPFVTVYSGAEGVDPTLADAISSMASLGDSFASAGLSELEAYFVPSRLTMFQVRAEARTNGGGVFAREAVIELNFLLRPAPFQVHAWRRGELG